MSKAEERALKAYPKAIEHYTSLTTREVVEIDVNEHFRKIYLKGYHQAEEEAIEKATEWVEDVLMTRLPYQIADELIADFKIKMDKD